MRRYDNSVFERVRQVEACALGLVECPPEPLVVSLWSKLPAAESTSEYLEQSAQLEWRASMIDAVHQFNFVFVDQHNRTRALHLVRALTSSIHQVWMGEHAAIECLQNPRCILPYDYSEPDDPAHTPNARDVRDEERGVIPMWRLMITSWVSASSETGRGSSVASWSAGGALRQGPASATSRGSCLALDPRNGVVEQDTASPSRGRWGSACSPHALIPPCLEHHAALHTAHTSLAAGPAAPNHPAPASRATGASRLPITVTSSGACTPLGNGTSSRTSNTYE